MPTGQGQLGWLKKLKVSISGRRPDQEEFYKDRARSLG